MKKRILKAGALFAVFATLIGFPHVVEARVDILPRKVVIEGRDRGGEITILNMFDKPGLYRLNIINYSQDEEGVYTLLEEPLSPHFDPEKLVRVSPKQFEVGANGRQKIRIAVKKPDDLPEGEYRFHVVATRYDTVAQQRASSDVQEREGQVSVQMSMNLGVSIPVVVRHGDLDSSATITNIEIKDSEAAGDVIPADAHVTIQRDGNASALGRINVFYTGQGVKKERIGEISNMNVFHEIQERVVKVPLEMDPRLGGELTVIYVNDDDKVIDEKTMSF